MKYSNIRPKIILSSTALSVFGIFLLSPAFVSADTDTTRVREDAPRIHSTDLRPDETDTEGRGTKEMRTRVIDRVRLEEQKTEDRPSQDTSPTEAPAPQSFLERARTILFERRTAQPEKQTEDRPEPQKNEERILETHSDTPSVGEMNASGTPETLRAREASSTETRDQQRADVEEKRKENIGRYLDNTSRKMDAAIERLNVLADRIESRIVKLEDADYDMTEARTKLDSARTSIELADKEIGVALSDAEETLAGDMNREAFGKVAETLAHSKENLRVAHDALVEAIRSMKATVQNGTTTGGTTSTTTPPTSTPGQVI